MTMQEFLTEVNKILPKGKKINAITEEEYSVIEKVYAWHPSISNSDGKGEIAYLYVHFGWVLIVDMLRRAKAIEEKENDISRVKNDFESSIKMLENEIEKLISGEWT